MLDFPFQYLSIPLFPSFRMPSTPKPCSISWLLQYYKFSIKWKKEKRDGKKKNLCNISFQYRKYVHTVNFHICMYVKEWGSTWETARDFIIQICWLNDMFALPDAWHTLKLMLFALALWCLPCHYSYCSIFSRPPSPFPASHVYSFLFLFCLAWQTSFLTTRSDMREGNFQ